MANPFKGLLDKIAQKFSQDPSRMLIITGLAAWTVSAVAQIGAVLFNPKIPKEQKSFLVPQEFADAMVNIGAFFFITQFTKKTVSKLFSTGKWAPKSVKSYLSKNKELYGNKIGKLDFNVEDILKKDANSPLKEYITCKDFSETVATIGAGILSSNIITPVVRNSSAATMQKKYLDNRDKVTITTPQANQTAFKSYGMRI